MPSESFHHQQELEVFKMGEKRARQIIRQIENARIEILAELTSLPEGTPTKARLVQTLKEVEVIIKELKRNLQELHSVSEPLGELAVKHYGQTAEKLTGSFLEISLQAINPETLKLFSLNELNNVTSITADYALRTIRSTMLREMAIKGKNPRAVAQKLMSKDGFLTKRYPIVETIVRTEANTIYNTQSLNAIVAGNAKYDLNLKKKIIEIIDPKRNHPISLVLNGQISPVLDEKGLPALFKASVAEVNARANAAGKTASGIFWQQKGGYYVGATLPAHYNERGVVVATDEAVNVK